MPNIVKTWNFVKIDTEKDYLGTKDTTGRLSSFFIHLIIFCEVSIWRNINLFPNKFKSKPFFCKRLHSIPQNIQYFDRDSCNPKCKFKKSFNSKKINLIHSKHLTNKFGYPVHWTLFKIRLSSSLLVLVRVESFERPTIWWINSLFNWWIKSSDQQNYFLKKN